MGIPASFLYNILSGIIRSMGDSKTPLAFLTLSSFLNIGLDLLCILVFRMGVAGAAVATVVSQLVSGLLCLLYMMKKFEILHIIIIMIQMSVFFAYMRFEGADWSDYES